jgi:hypothetical protein
LSTGARHVVVFGEDLAPERAGFADLLAARPDEYRRVFQDGPHSVFTLLEDEARSLSLLPTPVLPEGARSIPQAELRARASIRSDRACLALDGDARTYWTGGRFQESGQHFEIELAAPRPVVAIDIHAPARVMDVPASFRLSARNGDEDLGVLAERPLLRFHREQVFEPKNFVFRVVLPRPITLDRLRITVAQPVPGSYFSIHELRLYGAQ